MPRELYKKKGIAGVDAKEKRRLRRSIHQKEERDHAFLTKRIGSKDLSPLQEPTIQLQLRQPNVRPTINVRPAKVTQKSQSKLPFPRSTIACDSSKNDVKSTKTDGTRNRLMKWKEEREMKRKVEQMRSTKPGFKVCKVSEKTPYFLAKGAKKNDSRKKCPVVNSQVTSTTTVRKSARVAAKESKPATQKVSTRQPKATIVKPKYGVGTSKRFTSTKPNPPSPAKKMLKKTLAKNTLHVFPTISSFTFHKEIPVVLKSVKRPNLRKGTMQVKSHLPKPVFGEFKTVREGDTKGAAQFQHIKDTRKDMLNNIDIPSPIISAENPNIIIEKKDSKDAVHPHIMKDMLDDLDIPPPNSSAENPNIVTEEVMLVKSHLPQSVSSEDEPVAAIHKANTKGDVHLQHTQKDMLNDDVFSPISSAEKEVLPVESHSPTSVSSGDETALPAVSKEDTKGAAHFQHLMDTQKDLLNKLCATWETILEEETIPDEVCGDIRSSIGKTQLLMNKRFKQFSGLIVQCRDGLGEQRTHTNDLHGFWEMVDYQIVDVNKMFAVLMELKYNHWKSEQSEKPKAKKVIKKKLVVKTKKPKVDRQAARERLASIKAAMKARQTRQMDTDKIVFDAGFFRVESPAKTNEEQCDVGGAVIDTPNKVMGDNTPSVRPQSEHVSTAPEFTTLRSSPKGTPLVCRQQELLKAVLKASHIPNHGTPGISTLDKHSTPDEMMMRLRDLGLSSENRSTKKRSRRDSQRTKSAMPETDSAENAEKENNVLAQYLTPTVIRSPLTQRDDNIFNEESESFVGDLIEIPAMSLRSGRLRTGRISAFTPPRKSFALIGVKGDLMSFD